MSNTSIKLKKSSVSGKIPLVSDIDYGELAINYADGKLYYKHNDTSIRSFLDSGQILYLIDSDYLKSIINNTYLIATRPINVVEDPAPLLGGNLNLNGHNITDSGSSGSITMSGNITGGSITGTGDITGSNLISTLSSGDEGGEVKLAVPQTNTTLSGTKVSIDIFQNKLRIFEEGGTNRGAYIDLTQATAGVGSNLLAGGGGVLFDSTAVNSVLDSATVNGIGLSFSYLNGSISIANTGVIAGTYGSASLVPVLTVNAQGQIDSIGTVSVAGVSSTDWDSSTGNFIISTADGGSYYTKVTLDPYTTTNLSEGTNLYYTTARADSAFDVRLATKSTTNLSEGTNLYYTKSRADSDARNALTGSTGITYTKSTGIISTNDGQIVHDNLSGFVANEHIDHSGVSITAGSGLTGGGDITTSRTLNIGQGTGITVSADAISTNDGQIVHDNLSGFVANEHIDHSSVSITAGSGLTGGGDITTSRTLNIGQGTGITVSADAISTNDGQIVHDNLSGFVANEHIDHSTVNITAGSGLTGGGSIAATRTLAIDSSGLATYFSKVIVHDNTNGFVANEHIDHSGVTLTAGNGLTGGGTIETSRTFAVGAGVGIKVSADEVSIDSAEIVNYASPIRSLLSAGTGITYSAATGAISTNDGAIVHDNLSGFVANEHIDHTSVTLTAGSGLTGGGDISTSRTFNIGQGTGITVSADAISTNDGQIVHDNLSGFVANEHIDHSLVSIIAGNGLTGGGNITASRTLSIDSSQIRGLFSAGTGVTYSSGVISIGQAVGTGNTPTFTGLSAGSAKITSLATPTVATDAANKSYVDTVAAASLHYHDPVRVEAPLNLNATYNNGTDGVGATLTNAGTQAALVVDGVAVDSADRVLVYEQTTQTQNGVYVVTHKGSPTSNWVLTRSADTNSYAASSPTSLGKGDAFYVREGLTGAGELYVMNTEGTITFGTTNITFSQISSAQIYKAGYGIELSGTTFSVDSDRVVLSVNSLKGNITATNLLDAIKTVDGTTSGLDADLLDGNHASAFYLATNPSGYTTNTGTVTSVDMTVPNGFAISGRPITSSGTLALAYSAGYQGFTSTEATKLAGIETGATADMTASEILTAIKTVDGSGSGLDADLLDGLNPTTAATGSTIVSRDASGNFSAGSVTLSQIISSANSNFKVEPNSTSYLRELYVTTSNGGSTGYTQINEASVYMLNDSSGKDISLSVGANAYINTNYNFGIGTNIPTSKLHVVGNIAVTGTVDGRDVSVDGTKLDGIEAGATADMTASEILTAIKTVDGTTSGLDADLLDGNHASAFYLATNPNGYTTNTGTVTSVDMTVPTGFDISGRPITSSGTLALTYSAGYQGFTSTEASKLAGIEAGATADMTASEILTAIKTVDGASSGLDADLLDGQHGSYYRINVYNSSGTLLN